MTTTMPLLQINKLSIAFETDEGMVPAVEDITLSLQTGQTLGLVGESGSGKSVTSLAIMRLLPKKTARILSGEILFNHPKQGVIDLLKLNETQLQRIRGNQIGMIFQEPMTSLNPVKRCGWQVAESLIWHGIAKEKAAHSRVLHLFEEVKLPDPQTVFNKYPHELSGGQRQRVMIAMAIACNPPLLIADEPTTALDVTVQKSILDLLADIQQKHQMSMLFISHDLGVIHRVAHQAAVMRRGHIVEKGNTTSIFTQPAHPYTQGLVACRPRTDIRLVRLPVVADFENAARPVSEALFEGETPSQREQRHRKIYAQPPVLEVKDLEVNFITSRNLLGKPKKWFSAVQKVSFEVYKGETLGLVGESGCGKTTLGRALLRLLKPAAGQVVYKNTDLATLSESKLRRLRPMIQIIFQDPYSSLTPGIQVGSAIMEPMKVHNILDNDTQRKNKIIELLERVGLEAAHYKRYPHEFSGGQRQRICIARALALNPEFIICDESVSALDVSVQAQVLNLLNELKEEFGLTYIFISHDLSVVKYMSDRIMVMEKGVVVESGEADKLYFSPQQPYTRRLIEAVLDPAGSQKI
ncbi:MAG: ABC transporter ATP-binding protein [Bacteroidales bacterium]